MPHQIEPATAEQIVAVTDAVLVGNAAATDQFVADFCQLQLDSARHALAMAREIGFVSVAGASFRADGVFARYLICANDLQRASVFRLAIEQYAPFRFFRERIGLRDTPSLAADRVKAVFTIAAHREVIKDTLISLGSFCQALKHEGTGLYRVAEEDGGAKRYLVAAATVAADLEQARFAVAQRLGDASQAYLTKAGGIVDLATAYLKLGTSADPRAPVMYAGNAIESLLVQVAADRNVNIVNATGINSKAERLAQGHVIKSKHKAVLAYLGHVRNAADHGVDPDIGQQWGISQTTAVEYVHVAISAVSSIVSLLAGKYLV